MPTADLGRKARALRVRVDWSCADGRSGSVADGLCAVDFATPNAWNPRVVRQPLRDLAPVTVKTLKMDEAAHLRYQQGLMWTLANHPRVPKAVRDEVSRWGTCRDEFAGERDKYEIHVVDFTRGGRGLGEKGHLDGTTAARRTKEEESVCAMTGSTLHWIDEIDGEAYACREACDRMAALFAELKPRAIITHWPIDKHLDHVMTFAATLKAIKLAGIEPEIYFHEQDHQSRGFTPMHYVDITRVQETKDAVIRLYACQNPDDSIVKNKRVNGDFRGRSVGAIGSYFEAYSEYPGTVRGPGIFAGLR